MSKSLNLLNKSPHIPQVLQQLYQLELFQNEQNWNNFASNKKELLIACINLLSYYSHWWLMGGNRQQSDPDQRLKDTGIMDPIMDTPPEEWEKFYNMFPLIYFSLVFLQKEQVDQPLIKTIAFENLAACPSFEAYDLWLQRKAFTHYMHQQGAANTMNQITEHLDTEKQSPKPSPATTLDSIKSNDSSKEHDLIELDEEDNFFRIELLWYVVMKLNLSKTESSLIIQTIQNNPKFCCSSGPSNEYINAIEACSRST